MPLTYPVPNPVYTYSESVEQILVDCGNAAWGAYSTLFAALTNICVELLVSGYVDNSTVGFQTWVRLELATGAAGFETRIMEMSLGPIAANVHGGAFKVAIPVTIAAGTRLAASGYSSASAGTDVYVHVTVMTR